MDLILSLCMAGITFFFAWNINDLLIFWLGMVTALLWLVNSACKVKKIVDNRKG